MSNARSLGSTPCTVRSEDGGPEDAGSSGNRRTGKFLAVAAECGVPEYAARVLREEIRSTAVEIRRRRMTPAAGLRRVARIATKV
jgi:hypothetical protein